MSRPWAYLVIGLGFVANSVSILLGATVPTVPDRHLWVGMAWATAATCFVYVISPTVPTRPLFVWLPRIGVVRVGGFTSAQVASAALIIAAFARFVGAVLYNPTLGNRFGGGSLWGMLCVAFYRMHVARRYECRLHHVGDL